MKVLQCVFVFVGGNEARGFSGFVFSYFIIPSGHDAGILVEENLNLLKGIIFSCELHIFAHGC